MRSICKIYQYGLMINCWEEEEAEKHVDGIFCRIKWLHCAFFPSDETKTSNGLSITNDLRDISEAGVP